MQCKHCENTVSKNDRFCPHCGQRLLLLCKECDAEIITGARFCGKCGAPSPETLASSGSPSTETLLGYCAASGKGIRPSNEHFKCVQCGQLYLEAHRFEDKPVCQQCAYTSGMAQQLEAERAEQARIDAERRAQEEAPRREREAQERRKQEEEEAKKREEAELQARVEAYRKEQEAAEQERQRCELAEKECSRINSISLEITNWVLQMAKDIAPSDSIYPCSDELWSCVNAMGVITMLDQPDQVNEINQFLDKLRSGLMMVDMQEAYDTRRNRVELLSGVSNEPFEIESSSFDGKLDWNDVVWLTAACKLGPRDLNRSSEAIDEFLTEIENDKFKWPTMWVILIENLALMGFKDESLEVIDRALGYANTLSAYELRSLTNIIRLLWRFHGTEAIKARLNQIHALLRKCDEDVAYEYLRFIEDADLDYFEYVPNYFPIFYDEISFQNVKLAVCLARLGRSFEARDLLRKKRAGIREDGDDPEKSADYVAAKKVVKHYADGSIGALRLYEAEMLIEDVYDVKSICRILISENEWSQAVMLQKSVISGDHPFIKIEEDDDLKLDYEVCQELERHIFAGDVTVLRHLADMGQLCGSDKMERIEETLVREFELCCAARRYDVAEQILPHIKDERKNLEARRLLATQTLGYNQMELARKLLENLPSPKKEVAVIEGLMWLLGRSNDISSVVQEIDSSVFQCL